MEIELSAKHLKAMLIALIALVFTLPVLAVIGKPFTPAAPRLLTWQDWQVWKGERVYSRQITLLREDAGSVVEIMDGPKPSPVSAQIILDRVKRDTAQGLPELEASRTALLAAAQAVRDWAAGLADQDAADAALDHAQELLR